MNDIERTIEMWLDGDIEYTDLPDPMKKAVDAFIDSMEKADPTQSDVHVDGVNWGTPKKKKKAEPMSKQDSFVPPQGVRDAAKRAIGWIEEGKQGDGFTAVGRTRASQLANGEPVSMETIQRMRNYFSRHGVDRDADGFFAGSDKYPSPGRVAWDAWGGDAGKSWAEKIGGQEMANKALVHKAIEEQRFTLGPWYIPNKPDAHNEWTDADELQKALWDYVRSGDRGIRLQHNRDIVAGEWVEAMSFPIPITMSMNKGADASDVTYPAGTVFLGVQWKPWAWEMVKAGKITGFSIGGNAARVEMGVPAELAKQKAQQKRTITIKGVKYAIVSLGNQVGKSKVRNVAALYGPQDVVAIIRTDGERYWASGHSSLENLDHRIAQYAFSAVDKAAGKSFGGNRSAAGAYAARIRWQRRNTGIPDGSAPKPTTAAGKALGGAAGSLVTHCDLDAVAADMKAAGLSEPTGDMFYKHLTPERRAAWDAAIAEKVNGVPVNPNGPNAYMMGGGGASGKSSVIKEGIVDVPNANPKEGKVKAVDVNPDSAKDQLAGYNNMKAKGDKGAANFHHEESSAIAALTAGAGLRQGSDIVVDGVADNGAAKTMGKTDQYRALGAKRVELHVVTADIDVARQRNVERFNKEGRMVQKDALINGHKGVSKNFETYAASGKWDTITVTDTNTRPPSKIFEIAPSGKRRILDKGKYQKFLDKQNYVETDLGLDEAS